MFWVVHHIGGKCVPGRLKKNGGRPSKIGEKFHDALEEIKNMKIKNKTSKSRDRISTEKITNLIIRHNSWPDIAKDIIDAPEEEVRRYGL